MRYALPSSDNGLIAAVDAGGPGVAPLARWVGVNLLTAEPASLCCAPGERVAAWSGTLSEHGLFEVEMRNWWPGGVDRLHAAVDRFCMAGVPLLLRPHARHVLSDWNQSLRFLGRRAAMGDLTTGLLIDPCALLTLNMLRNGKGPEHVARLMEEVCGFAAGGDGRIAGVVVSNLQRPVDEGDGLGVDEGACPLRCATDDSRAVFAAGWLEGLVQASGLVVVEREPLV